MGLPAWPNRERGARFKLESFLPPDTRRSSLDAALFDEDWRLRDGWTCEYTDGGGAIFVFKNKGDIDGPGITDTQLKKYRHKQPLPAPRRSGGSLFG
ncbi:hypothetical protein Asppvi_005883 [Aspergillus pseudoviridinutans]|uniref:Uncharacterized protein n=1 Tax=Aspergillus pseudoviridinutans TaxID=1517512 RepID=A0A9P3BFI9_9EURO|nr:uncharacterized protein Asppvi_005883 [Aspergillus pseudoviridinutans]GIJ86984.1 hypothetical protein Asppvi_005883 [Aspergillus pseudoviridinutans]